MAQQLNRKCVICGANEFQEVYEHLQECDRCGVVFDERIPTQTELEEHYAKYVREIGYDSPVSQRRREQVLDGFESTMMTRRLLDVGTGTGVFLDQARPRGWKTHGTEFTENAIEMCSARGHTMHLGTLVEQAFPDKYFDVVIYSEVIEHINNQPEEFAEVYRILRPGGLLYLTTPNFGALERRLLGTDWDVIVYPEHLVYFDKGSLEFLMSSVGLEQEKLVATGTSVSKSVRGVRKKVGLEAPAVKKESQPDGRHRTSRSRRSADERLRKTLEFGPMHWIKEGANRLLDLGSCGNTLRGWYRRPS